MRLREISELAPDWDGYGGEPFESACVEHAVAILLALPNAVPPPEVTPNPNGTISLDWENGQQAVSLEIGIDRYSTFWESLNGIKTDRGELTQGLPDLVARALANLFPEAAHWTA